MTQSLVNNLNNIQELMAESQQKLQAAKTELSNVDNKTSTDFEKIYNKQIDLKTDKSAQKQDKKIAGSSSTTNSTTNISTEKQAVDINIEKADNTKNTNTEETNSINNTIRQESVLKTLEDIKNNYRIPLTETNVLTLKEVIAEAIGEANVETSLDLTLNKDIKDVISQFKEFIEGSITKNDEKVSTEESEEALEIEIDNNNGYTEQEDIVSEELLENLSQKVSVDNTTLDTKSLYEQIFASAKKAVKVVENSNTEKVSFDNSVDFSETLNIEDIENTQIKTTTGEETKQTSQNLEDIIDEDILKDLNIESVEADSADSNSGSLMEHQTPQEQAVKAMLQQEGEAFELKIENVNKSQATQPTQSKPVDANPSKILDQITKQMEGLQNSSKVNIVLNPESLGKVSIQLIKTGEGLSAQFTVASQEVRDMLMKGLDGLKEALISQGVGVDNVSVKLNETQKSEYNADWTEQEGSRGGNKEQGQSKQGKENNETFEQMMAQFNLENGKV